MIFLVTELLRQHFPDILNLQHRHMPSAPNIIWTISEIYFGNTDSHN